MYIPKHTHTCIYLYIYIYLCVCVCIHLQTSMDRCLDKPDFTKAIISSLFIFVTANLTGEGFRVTLNAQPKKL